MSSHFSQLDVFQNVSSLIQLLFSSFVRSVASRVIQNVNGLYVFLQCTWGFSCTWNDNYHPVPFLMFFVVWWTVSADKILSGYVSGGLIGEPPVLFNRNLIHT